MKSVTGDSRLVGFRLVVEVDPLEDAIEVFAVPDRVAELETLEAYAGDPTHARVSRTATRVKVKHFNSLGLA